MRRKKGFPEGQAFFFWASLGQSQVNPGFASGDFLFLAFLKGFFWVLFFSTVFGKAK